MTNAEIVKRLREDQSHYQAHTIEYLEIQKQIDYLETQSIGEKRPLDALCDALSSARIIAGALYEKKANEKKYMQAVYFSTLRDLLDKEIQGVKDYCYAALRTERCKKEEKE